MKTFTFTLAALALFFSAGTTAPVPIPQAENQGDFVRTCNQITLTPDLYLEASCQINHENPEQLRRTRIRLDVCVTNLNGRLSWAQEGQFGGSCKDIYIEGSSLRATCKVSDNEFAPQSMLNLNEHLVNDFGVLKCMGNPGIDVA